MPEKVVKKQDIFGDITIRRSYPNGKKPRLEFEFPEDDRTFTRFYNTEFANMLKVVAARYGKHLKTDDIEDICIMSFNDLKRNIDEGKITKEKLTVPIRKYLEKICIFKASKYFDRMDPVVKETESLDQQWSDAYGEVDDSRIDKLLAKMNDAVENDADDYNVSEHDKRLENMVRDIVDSLPAPCNEIFVDHYWGELKYKVIALQRHFAKPGAIKMTAHRCHDKFYKRVQELKEKIGYQGKKYATRNNKKEKK